MTDEEVVKIAQSLTHREWTCLAAFCILNKYPYSENEIVIRLWEKGLIAKEKGLGGVPWVSISERGCRVWAWRELFWKRNP